MFAAVVFDLDGTLVDSEAVSLATGLEVFGRYDPGYDTDFFHSLTGVDDQTAKTRLVAMLPAEVSYDAVYGEWRRLIRARFLREGVPLKPFARESLEHLKGLGLPLALATSSLQESASFKMNRADITQYFDQVVVRESILSPKPAPDAYVEAARLLGVDPALCLAFEDSTPGAIAAHAAGMRVIQIPDVTAPPENPIWEVEPDLWSALRHLGLRADG